MNILLVCAMEKEAKVLINNYNLNLIKDNFYNNGNISLIITDISRNGVVNSMISLSTYYDLKNAVIINVGLVGSNNLNIGEIVCVNKSYGYHFDLTPFDEPLYQAPFSPYQLNTLDNMRKIDCYTSDGFVLQTNIKKTCIFDMELNSLILFPHHKIYSIKIVSDTLSKELYTEFNYDNAMTNCLKYIDAIIKDSNK